MTNHRLNHFLSLVLCLCAANAFAQLNLPIQTMNGTQYYYYKVKSKETIYGIAHKLHLSQDEIVKYNPTAATGVKDKQLLFFPVADFNKQPAAEPQQNPTLPKSSDFTHTVQPGETLFGLSKTYGISIDDIIAQNPVLNGGKLKSGMVLHISQPTSGSIFVKIEPGNTLCSTAMRYNTAV